MSETSAIDEKKNGSTEDTTTKGVFISSLISIGTFIVITFIGISVLYNTKVAQANIIPTSNDCSPFSNSTDSVEAVQINVDIIKSTGTDGNLEERSTKIVFPYSENIEIIKNGILGLGYIQKWRESEKSSPLWIYLLSIEEELFSNYYKLLKMFYDLLAKTCSETVIVFLAPFLFIIVLFITSMLNGLYACYLWFSKLYLLFSTKKECKYEDVLGPDGKPLLIPGTNNPYRELKVKWEYKKGEMMKQWFWAGIYIFIAWISFFSVGISIIIPLIIMLMTLYVLFIPLMLVGEIHDSPDHKKYSFGSLITNVLKYKLNIIMYILTFFIASGVSSALGSMGLVVSILAIFFLLFFYPNVYSSYQPGEGDYSTIGLIPFKIAQKICKENDFNGSPCPTEGDTKVGGGRGKRVKNV